MADKTADQKAAEQKQQSQLSAQQKLSDQANAPSVGGPSEADQKRAQEYAEAQAERQALDPRTPESPSASGGTLRGGEGQDAKGRKRRLRAQQDMSHTDANGDEVDRVRAGDMVDEDSPLVGMHPHLFERFE